MRYAFQPDHMETSGVLAVRKSSTHTSRKTIRMQINDLYSDKVGAIVREITANAADSHHRARQDRPFYVHCPTPLEPEFYVRDFGAGMTDQVMEDVYIVIGLSDKDQSDEETGMWGLGSKTPFAYADHYTITCYDGETARHYGYGIADDGIPNLYTLAVEPSTEPRGVRIGLAVEAKDFHLFDEAIRFNVAAHEGKFEHNMGDVPIGTLAYRGDGWQAYTESPIDPKAGSSYYAQSWWVRQGCVLYPISDSQITLPRDHRSGVSRSRVYILDCPIGSVRMTPSREALQYDDEVVAYLKTRIDAVTQEIGAAVEEATKDIVSVVDYYEAVNKLKPDFVNRTYVHPTTGLKSPALELGYPSLLFSAKASMSGGEWAFDMPPVLDLRFTNVKGRRIFLLDDVTPLLDPSRGADDAVPGAKKWLTRSEMRRVSRFVRHFLTARRIDEALVVCNADWSDDYIQAITTYGGQTVASVERLTFDALRAAVPRRVAPPTVSKSDPPIRGLALAKAAGEQKPVYEVLPATPTIAWVASDEYRKLAGPMFKLARKAKIESLYIAAAGEPQRRMAEAGHPHLSVLVENLFTASGWTMADHEFYRQAFRSNYESKAIDFLKNLKRVDAAEFKRLAQGDGVYSALAKKLSPYLDKTEVTLSDDERRVVEVLTPATKTAAPKRLVDAKALNATLKSSYYNPTVKFVQDLKVTPARAAAFVSAVLALQTLIPPTEEH